MGRQEVAAEIKRKKLVSETGVSGDTPRGSERLALCSQDIFTYLKLLSHLQKERDSGSWCPSILFLLLHFSLPWTLPSMHGG